MNRIEFDELVKLHSIGWRWFQIHANQRMQIVSFWFVAMSFLSTGNVIAYTSKRYGASLVVGLAVAVASVIFLFLDIRTRELISYGERLMAATEDQIKFSSSIDEVVMVGTMHTSGRKTVSYRTLFTLLYTSAVIFGLVSVAASAAAMLSYCSLLAPKGVDIEDISMDRTSMEAGTVIKAATILARSSG